MTKTKKNLMIALLLTAIAIAAAAGFILYRSAPSSVSIYTSIEKTQYNYGDTLDTAGLSLLVTYNSGRVEVVTDGIVCTPMELTMSGSVEITADYRGKATVFSVESVPVLTGIRVASGPDTTWYAVNSHLDTTGLTLEASYNDGSTGILAEGFTCSPETLTQPGDQEITVTYENQTASFPVEVVGISQLSVKRFSARDVYLVGELPEPDDAVLEVTYTDGSTAMISEGYSVSGGPFTEPGPGEYTITFEGKEVTYPVNVLPAVGFETFEAYFSSVGDDSGLGHNADGNWVNWVMIMYVDFPEEAMDRINPVVTCSWTEEVNHYQTLGDAFSGAKAGRTTVECIPFPAEYTPNGNHKISIYLYIPDDPAIAGEQFVTLRFGADEITVYFTLEYTGDYTNGTGWKCTNIRY